MQMHIETVAHIGSSNTRVVRRRPATAATMPMHGAAKDVSYVTSTPDTQSPKRRPATRSERRRQATYSLIGSSSKMRR